MFPLLDYAKMLYIEEHRTSQVLHPGAHFNAFETYILSLLNSSKSFPGVLRHNTVIVVMCRLLLLNNAASSV